jgi:hypothetical protein
MMMLIATITMHALLILAIPSLDASTFKPTALVTCALPTHAIHQRYSLILLKQHIQILISHLRVALLILKPIAMTMIHAQPILVTQILVA